MQMQSLQANEVNANCRVLRNDYCFIENPEKVVLKPGENLKIIVSNPNAIKTLDIVNDAKGVIGIKSIPDSSFKSFPKLEKLLINSNNINVLQCDCYKDAKTLTSLSLNHNEITTVPSKVFSYLSSVSDLALEQNRIETIEDNAFEGMTNLSRINLNRNVIRTLHRLAFAGAINLNDLYLGWNHIDVIEEGALNLPKLKSLVLTGNKLKILSDTLLIGAPNLEIADFEKNDIKFVGKALLHCNALQLLILSDNPVEDVNLTALANLEKLKYLNLQSTKFSFPSELPLSRPNESKLETIKLNWNGLSNPYFFKHLSVFPNLEKIKASGNNFTVFNDIKNIRKYFPNLKKINFDYNQPPLCTWIVENEQYFKGIGVASTSNNGLCTSADFVDDYWSEEFED